MEDKLIVDTLLRSDLASGPQFEAETKKQLLEQLNALSDEDEDEDW